MTDDICGATTQQGTPCQNDAGLGTSHAGVGKCWRHEDSRTQSLNAHAKRAVHAVADALDIPAKPLIALILGVFGGAYIAHYPGEFGTYAQWLIVALGGGRLLGKASSRSGPSWLRGEHIDTILLGAAVGYLAVWWPHQGIDLIPVLDYWAGHSHGT